ncbi:MAG: hypothetical protein WCE21_03565 [Candidatus Babeliales bacterium]
MLIHRKAVLTYIFVCCSTALLPTPDNSMHYATQGPFVIEHTGLYAVYIHRLSWKFWKHAATIKEVSAVTNQSESMVQGAIDKQDPVLRSFDTDKIQNLSMLLKQLGCSFEIKEMRYAFPDEKSKKEAETDLELQAFKEHIETVLKGSHPN